MSTPYSSTLALQAMKGKIPQWEVIAYSALDTGSVYKIQSKWLLSPSRNLLLIYTKLDCFSPTCMQKVLLKST